MVADPTNFWPNFNVYTWPEVECGDNLSVAVKVLDEYGIPVAANSRDIGGPLDNVDIKHMDCMTVIKSSLFDAAAKEGKIFEPNVNEYGEVEFVEIGVNNADMDIYYTIQTQSYKEQCKGVMITGQKPLPVRKPLEWKRIWGEESNKHVYDTQGMSENCSNQLFKTWATVVFPDPHMQSAFEDGIDNLYEITKENPWDKIIGYAYYIYHGDFASDDTTVQYQRQAKAIIQVGNDGLSDYGPTLGTLWKKEEVVPGGAEQTCWFDVDSPPSNAGVEIVIPESLRFERVRQDGVYKTDNFLGVSEIFVVGTELDVCKGLPINNLEASTEENTNVWVRSNNIIQKTLRLSEGIHYVIVYSEESYYKTARVVFANNSRTGDEAKYGTDTQFYLMREGELFAQYGESVFSLTGTILPLGGTKGFWIKQVWATIDLDTPSFVVTDPRGNARLIADQLEVLVAPIVITDEPAPIAFNGQIIDQSHNIFDNDPTTAQDLTDTELEQAWALLEGGGLTMSFSYLNEEEVVTLSRTLYEYLNNDSTQIETTYVCGPDSDPKIGDQAPAGVINNIRYSYSDSGAYTISVNAGPKIIGNFSELSQGLYFKQQNEASGMQGTIIQDQGNHVIFKVRIDGYGDRYAINLSPTILRSGDIVSCTVYNNPVGEQ